MRGRSRSRTVGVPPKMRHLANEDPAAEPGDFAPRAERAAAQQLIPWAEHFADRRDPRCRPVLLRHAPAARSRSSTSCSAGVNDQPQHARELAQALQDAAGERQPHPLQRGRRPARTCGRKADDVCRFQDDPPQDRRQRPRPQVPRPRHRRGVRTTTPQASRRRASRNNW